MGSTTTRPKVGHRRRGPYGEREAAEKAQRNILIVRLVEQGEPVENIRLLTGLSRHQLARIVRAARPGASLARVVTAEEYRGFRRDYAHDPETLAWLATLRVDARRNGRAIASEA